MIQNVNGATDQFLADLNRIQSSADRAQREISSGLKVEVPSDAPDQIRGILQLRAEIQRNAQVQSNLTIVKADVDTADTTVQAAIQALDRARELATQGSGSLPTADQRKSMAQEVGGVLDTLVRLSRAAVAGRSIFSGDSDLDTRQIMDADGVSFRVALSARDVFDNRNADDSPAPGNVLAAVQGLKTALENNDQHGIEAAADALRAAGNHLNQQLAFYGATQNRIQEALDRASTLEVQEKASLSEQVDADLAVASTELALASTHQQAALSARARMPQTSLFDFLA